MFRECVLNYCFRKKKKKLKGLERANFLKEAVLARGGSVVLVLWDCSNCNEKCCKYLSDFHCFTLSPPQASVRSQSSPTAVSKEPPDDAGWQRLLGNCNFAPV